MQITHLGHSCVLVALAGQRILIDPGNLSVGWDQLDDLSAVLITHQHADHADPVRLPPFLAAHTGLLVAAEPSVAAQVELPGAIRELRPGAGFHIGGVTVTPVGGWHAVIHADIDRVANVGLVIAAPGEPTLFHPGDSLASTPAGVAVGLIPLMAPWAALKETIDFTRALGARQGVLIHDGLLNPTGYRIMSGHLNRLTDTEIVDLRDRRPWSPRLA